jgi:hypothetical protein
MLRAFSAMLKITLKMGYNTIFLYIDINQVFFPVIDKAFR